VINLTTEDANSALDVDIVSAMSAGRNGVKKGFLLLGSRRKIVESWIIREKNFISGGTEVDLFPYCKSFG
jgi:hypothetical protein